MARSDRILSLASSVQLETVKLKRLDCDGKTHRAILAITRTITESVTRLKREALAIQREESQQQIRRQNQQRRRSQPREVRA